jgi:hypothetical protein
VKDQETEQSALCSNIGAPSKGAREKKNITEKFVSSGKASGLFSEVRGSNLGQGLTILIAEFSLFSSVSVVTFHNI